MAIPLAAGATRSRTGLVVAASTVGVTLAAGLAALGLDLNTSAADRESAASGLGSLSSLVGLLLAIPAAAILCRYPRHAVGWILARDRHGLGRSTGWPSAGRRTVTPPRRTSR